MKLIIEPVALVCNAAICVLECAFSMHFVVEPVSPVFATFIVVEHTIS